MDLLEQYGAVSKEVEHQLTLQQLGECALVDTMGGLLAGTNSFSTGYPLIAFAYRNLK